VIDVESFASQLADCYQRMWLIAAAVTGDRAEADDIVQEASIIGLQKRADFTAGSNFPAWMAQIVRLTALNHRKKSDRRKLRVTDPARIDNSMTASEGDTQETTFPLSVDGRLSDGQMHFDDEVLSALYEISDVARICLLLRVVEQLSYDDIAQTLQIPAGTAMSHVHRSKQSIRERLKSRGRQSSNCCIHQGKER
jgi:RNA polymerase sigma-70 factor, ECF subfamily